MHTMWEEGDKMDLAMRLEQCGFDKEQPVFILIQIYMISNPKPFKTKLPSKTIGIAQTCQPACVGQVPEAVRDDQHKERFEEEQRGHGLVQQGGHVKSLTLEPDSWCSKWSVGGVQYCLISVSTCWACKSARRT